MTANEIVLKRFKSFAWAFLYQFITWSLGWLAANSGLMPFNPTINTILGLVAAQISKWWANRQANLGKTFWGRAK